MLENVHFENIQMEADYGMICSNTKNVTIKNLTLTTKKTPVIDLKNSSDVMIDGMNVQPEMLPLIHISGVRTWNTVFKNVAIINADKQIAIGKEVVKDRIQVMK